MMPTPFQLKILRQKAGGKTDLAAARALGVGERTIRRQIESLIGVLAVSNRAALFVEVGRRGWLDLLAENDSADEDAVQEDPADDDPGHDVTLEPAAARVPTMSARR